MVYHRPRFHQDNHRPREEGTDYPTEVLAVLWLLSPQTGQVKSGTNEVTPSHFAAPKETSLGYFEANMWMILNT
jgi:hypothetical protein